MADETGIPTLDQFLADARPLNPDASNADLVAAYEEHFGTSANVRPKADLPTFEEFNKETKPLNPGSTKAERRQAWEENFASIGAREKKPTFWESFKQGAKQGWLGVQEAAQGTKERLLDPNDPLKQFTHDAGNALAEEAAKHGLPDDLASKPFWDRIRDPEYLGNFMGNIAVQSAPSALGAVAGGVVGGPVGAAAGMAGVTFFQEAGQSYREAYDKYKKAGFSDEKAHENAYQASGIAGAVSGMVNALAVPASLMSPAKSMVKNLFMRYVGNVAVDVGDQATGNVVAKATYDPNRDLTQGLPEAAAGSALLGAPENMAIVKAVAQERKTPDAGVKPNLTQTPSSSGQAPPADTGGLRSTPLPPSGGGPSAQTEIDRVTPILQAKNVDEIVTNANKVVDDIPIDMDALEKEVSSGVQPELDKIAKDAQEQLKTAKLDEDQTTLDDLAVKTSVGEKTFVPQDALNHYKFDAVSPQDLPDAPTAPEMVNGREVHAITKPQYQALNDVLSLDGTKMVLFTPGQGSSLKVDGFANAKAFPDTIFVNAKTAADPATIAFHEVQHLMQKSELFASYRKTISEELKPGATEGAKLIHPNGDVMNEIMSDIHGDAMTRPEFHQKLIRNLESQVGPEDAKSVLTNFVNVLRDKIAKITQYITRRHFSDVGGNLAERYVKNLSRVHDALASALTEHYKQKVLGERASQLKDAGAFVTSQELQAKAETHAATVAAIKPQSSQQISDEQMTKAYESASKNISPMALKEFGTNLGKVGWDMYGGPTTGLGEALSKKLGDTYNHVGVIAQASKNTKAKQDAVAIIRSLSDRVDDDQKVAELQKIKLKSKGTPEGMILQRALERLVPKEVVNSTESKPVEKKKESIKVDQKETHNGKEKKTEVLEQKPRSSEDVQKEIDAEEDKLVEKGVDVSSLYDEQDEQGKLLKGYQNYQPMPEKLAGLYRERNAIDLKDKQQFHEAIIRQSKLDRSEANGALEALFLTPGNLTHHFQDTLSRWNIDTTQNMTKLYNYFLYKKYGDRNMGEDFDDKYAKFVTGGTADKPTIAATTRDGKGLDQDVLDKVGAIWNAIAKNTGNPEHSFKMTNGQLGIEDQTQFMPQPPPQTPTGPSYGLSEPTKIDGYIRTLQDKHVDLRRLVQAMQDAGRQVPDELNPVFREEMFHKRAQQRADDFTNQEMKPLVDAMRSNNISLEELDQYAHARHVINDDLNAKLQAMNPDLEGTPDYQKLAGITDEEARRILAGPKAAAMAPLMRRIDAMIEKTRNMMVEYGLESQDRIDRWRDQYTSYVPLHREGFEDEGSTTGTGMSVRGTTAKDRLGSALKVTNVIANIAQARDQVISRGEKMRPVVALAGLMLKFPNKELGKLDKYAPVTYTDPTTGLTQTIPGDLADYKRPTIRKRVPGSWDDYLAAEGYTTDQFAALSRAEKEQIKQGFPQWSQEHSEVKAFPDPTYKSRDNVVNFRVAGKDYAIVFNEKNERAKQIATGLKNLDTVQLNAIMKAIAPYTRYLAAINTQYNPIFGIKNFIRDVGFAMTSLTSTELNGKQAEVLRNARQMTGGIFSDARAVRRGETGTSPAAQWWERFEHVGGPTGYRDLFFTSTERAEAINDLLNPRAWKNIRSATQFIHKLEGTALFQGLSDYNLMMENSIRLAVFKTGVENGLSDIKAASLAKNVTVNFNRKGQVGAQLGSLYAFFNANMQGSARIIETLFDRDPNAALGGRLSANGKRIITGGILLGVVQASMLALAGFDDDQPPEYVKSRNLIIPDPTGATDKGYLSIPLPLGFNLLPSVGRLAAEAVFQGLDGRSPKILEKGGNLMAEMVDMFNPLGSSSSIAQTALPTVVDPLVALNENKDWTGKQIYQEDHSDLKKTPGHTRAKDSATIWAVGLSKMINWATGGTDYVPGKLSPSPDAIDYLVGQATGGVGREVGKIEQTIRTAATGEELPPHKIPGVGGFIGSAGGTSGLRDTFYNNIRDVNAAAMELEGRMKHGEDVKEFYQEHPEAGLKTQAGRFQKQLSELRRQKRELLSSGGSREDVQRTEKQITNTMQLFNDQVERSRKK